MCFEKGLRRRGFECTGRPICGGFAIPTLRAAETIAFAWICRGGMRPAPPTSAMSNGTRRALFVALMVVAAVPLGYVVLANAFLSPGGIRLLTRGTNSIKVEYGSAWTVWPGVVHAHNLVVTIQDPNVQSMMEFERG